MSHLTRYTVAIISVVVALMLTLLLQPLLKSTVFSLFFAAVTFSSWYGGLAAGLLATILSILASNFFLMPVTANLVIRHGANLLHLILFSTLALLVSSLNAGLRTARQRAEINLAKLTLSEQRYRRIVDTAYEGIWLLNAQLATEYFNQRLAQMLGYGTEEISNYSFFDFVDETLKSEVQTIFTQWQHGERQRFDCRFCTKNGSTLWVIVSTTPILTSQGNFNGVLLMLTDITARKQVEAERSELLNREQSARAEAEAANRIKDEFLAMLSHELRSPLNPILGWAEILQRQKLNPETTNYALKTIERNAKLQTKLLEDLLDVSRIVQGKICLDSYPVSLISAIESSIEIVRWLAEQKNINLLFSILDSAKYYIFGDCKRLQQIVWNLLSNAIKFTPKGGRVDIELSLLEDANQKFAQIKVKDTGIGIQPEFLPYVFKSFRQADSSTTKKFSGLGLGLAIVHHLVQLHEGIVEAQSPGEGKGATFIVKLPILEVQDDQQEFSTDTNLISTSSLLANLKILVVDDEPDIRDLLVFILKQYGAIVTVANCAEQALDILANSKQDLLLSDIGMPDMNGYMLISQIRANDKQIPAIALSGYARELDKEQAQAAGFHLSLAKPIETEDLIAAIVSITQKR